MQKLTHSQLIAIVAARNGAAIVGIEALTDAKARKTGNPHGAIFKHVRAVGFVGANYENAVKREGGRQGAEDAAGFVAASLPWGAWHVANKVISHKGDFYLRTQSTPGQRNRQPARLLSYRDSKGQFLSRDAVRPFLPAPSVSKKQADVGLGMEAAEQVMVRTYKFSSIRKVRVNGQSFELVADAKG